MMAWKWHQLDRMEIICISLQRDDYASLIFYGPDVLPDTQTNSVKALKASEEFGKFTK